MKTTENQRDIFKFSIARAVEKLLPYRQQPGLGSIFFTLSTPDAVKWHEFPILELTLQDVILNKFPSGNTYKTPVSKVFHSLCL